MSTKQPLGNMSPEKEQQLFRFFESITSITDLEKLLLQVISDLPSLLKLDYCSVYLTHNYVSEYRDILLDASGQIIQVSHTIKRFVVLAKTNKVNLAGNIGKAYYASGEDFVGWVFEHRKNLVLKDMTATNDIDEITPGITLLGKYAGLGSQGLGGKRIPALYIPLAIGDTTIGVIEMQRKPKGRQFGKQDEQIAVIVAHLIAGLIQKDQMLADQEEVISKLTELGAEEDVDEVCRKITEYLTSMLNCPQCDLYLQEGKTRCIKLKYRNGKDYQKNAPQYCPGDGLIGWVFKTGKYLLIDDIRRYLEPVHLTDNLLMQISDGIGVNEDDTIIEVLEKNKEYIRELRGESPFLAVPVFARDGSVQGVLTTHFLTHRVTSRQHPFSRFELYQVNIAARTIEIALQNDLNSRKSNFMLMLNQTDSLPKIFDLITNEIPVLLRCSDTFIFELNRSLARPIQLVASSLGKVELKYDFGEGKTGFCALSEKTLIISHFGKGRLSTKTQQEEKERLQRTCANDLVQELLDDNGDSVGLIRLRDGEKGSPEIHAQFKRLCQKQIITRGRGLPTDHSEIYLKHGSKPSYSFVAVPIRKRENKEPGSFGGVITFLREYARVPFAAEDIEFVEAIANSLAAIMELLDLQKRQSTLLLTMAHEFSIPLTGIRVHIEGIYDDTAPETPVHKDAKKAIDQLTRLETMSETIQGVVAGKRLSREFSSVNIFRPIAIACEPFLEEANFHGCTILKPDAKNPGGFPFIEMVEIELIMAFRNIIHNAVKYSFKPPPQQDRYRYIKISGDWETPERANYIVTIQNYGVGITQEEIRKGLVFQPFYRGVLSTDRNRTGSGFGLAYARRIVEEVHHGEVKIYSRQLAGEAYLTTVTIKLPAHQPRQDREGRDGN